MRHWFEAPAATYQMDVTRTRRSRHPVSIACCFFAPGQLPRTAVKQRTLTHVKLSPCACCFLRLCLKHELWMINGDEFTCVPWVAMKIHVD